MRKETTHISKGGFIHVIGQGKLGYGILNYFRNISKSNFSLNGIFWGTLYRHTAPLPRHTHFQVSKLQASSQANTETRTSLRIKWTLHDCIISSYFRFTNKLCKQILLGTFEIHVACTCTQTCKLFIFVSIFTLSIKLQISINVYHLPVWFLLAVRKRPRPLLSATCRHSWSVGTNTYKGIQLINAVTSLAVQFIWAVPSEKSTFKHAHSDHPAHAQSIIRALALHSYIIVSNDSDSGQ